MTDTGNGVLILGGGLTGLSAGHVLANAGRSVTVLECGTQVGGISRTIEHCGFRFDLGGHRFFTKDERINAFVNGLMGSELIKVPRKSKILLRGKYFDYPLKPANALFGMGIPVTLRILADYGIERIKRLFRRPEAVSLEDWVVANFGRTMFSIYFKEYSEKVWGIPCDRISAEWVAQRIQGLSLSRAIANAFSRRSGADVPSLVDEFSYPELGIGRIAERLREEIERSGRVFTGTLVELIEHQASSIRAIVVRDRTGERTLRAQEVISSIPLTRLVSMLTPPPPEPVLSAAARLKFRDLVIVAVMVNRRRVTDQTWIYLPEKNIPFGRIHEPTNWSEKMAPEGKTLLVTEYFSFQGDETWQLDDRALAEVTVQNLERLGFLRAAEVLDSAVHRIPKAYPLFETGYRRHLGEINEYLSQFKNLHTAGRSGVFQYLNMDHAMDSGIRAAEKILSHSASAH